MKIETTTGGRLHTLTLDDRELAIVESSLNLTSNEPNSDNYLDGSYALWDVIQALTSDLDIEIPNPK